MKLTVEDIERIIKEVEEWEMEINGLDDALDYWYYVAQHEDAGDRS